MSTYDVYTYLIIHCKVRVTVEADSKDAAMDAATDLMPSNSDKGSSSRWRATVDLKAPKGTRISVMKAEHFEHASGTDKVRKLAVA